MISMSHGILDSNNDDEVSCHGNVEGGVRTPNVFVVDTGMTRRDACMHQQALMSFALSLEPYEYPDRDIGIGAAGKEELRSCSKI